MNVYSWMCKTLTRNRGEQKWRIRPQPEIYDPPVGHTGG